MTDDIDPTVQHGQDEPSGDLEAQNHGAVKNEPVAPPNFPSAPPGVMLHHSVIST